MKNNYTYMLECQDGSYYTGWTNDIKKRFRAHLLGKGAKYTKVHKPLKLVYYECFESKQEAMQKEYAIKQLSHQEKGKLASSFEKADVLYPKDVL